MLWFNTNCITATPDKFQGIILWNADLENPKFHIEDCILKPKCDPKILDITILTSN